MSEGFVVLLALALVFGPPIGVVVLFARVAELGRRLSALEAAGARTTGDAIAPAIAPSPSGAGAASPPVGAPVGPAAAALAPQVAPREQAGETAPPAAVPPTVPELTPRPPPSARPALATVVEQALAGRWMVWLGAVAIALAAVFLFAWAIEEGWLGPVPRVGLGLALGAALVLGGERARRAEAAGPPRPGADLAGPALTGAGVFALYVSVYAAHALYGLTGPAGAFVALAFVSLAALALALLHGPAVAIIALAGGYLVPLLVVGGEPQAAPVFLFLAVLSVACLALMRWRRWRAPAAGVLAGGLGWPLLWLAGPWTPADEGVLGLYAVALAAAFAGLGAGVSVARLGAAAPVRAGLVMIDVAGLGFALSGAVLVFVVGAAGYDTGGFVLLALYAVVALLFGVARGAWEALAVIGAVAVGVAMLLWPPPFAPAPPEAPPGFDPAIVRETFGPRAIPPEFLPFARALAGFAALFGAAGIFALPRAATPALWAALAAAMPLGLLALGYWRIGGFETDVGWATLAAGLALACFGGAAVARRRLAPERGDAPVAVLAAGSTAALALGFAALMREAWLTVAIALEVPVLAWLSMRLGVRALRIVILGAAAAVIVRLVLNPAVLEYEGGAGAFGWVLYGYGLPAAAFLAAGRLLGRDGQDPLASLCLSAAVAFAVLMVSLQIRLWTAGALAAPGYGLLDQAPQTLWWLGAAWLLLRREAAARLETAAVGGRVLLGLAVAQLVLGHFGRANPLLNGEAVGAWPVVNLLGAAYLAPSLLLAGLAADRAVMLAAPVRRGLRALAGLLGFGWLTLETRRAFQGSLLGLDRPATDAEVYAYSAVWIAAALGLLALGILRRSAPWRHAGLAVLTAAVVKVFLYDMADLTGLLRVVSFLGLGLALIGIGWTYRRFVAAPAAG